MKKLYTVLALLLLLSTACDEEHESTTSISGDSGISFDQSIDHWHELKVNKGNSYEYSLKFSSWTGMESTTTLTIEDGLVARRAYEKYTIQYPEQDTTFLESYVEVGESLGSHAQGVPLYTIDDLYETCAAEYLQVDENLNTLFFNTDAGGIMNLCGYVPENCADDCFVGVDIESFRWKDDQQ